jgi:hypothetical protein
MVLGILMTMSCSQAGQPAAVKSATPPAVASTAASTAASPVASPSPTAFPGDLPLSQVAFSCRLPIYLQTGYEGSVDFSRKGAFITFPAATMTIDPIGTGGGYFDRAFNRWLPVTRTAVSPDGAHYAYVDMVQFELHVLDVVSGKERTFPLAAIGANYVFDYAAEGIYMTFGFEGLHGLWLVNPVTGSSHQVPGITTPQASGGAGVVWNAEVNPADPNPINTASSAGILPDQITRVDLKSGSSKPWLYRPGVGLGVIALDFQGSPLIAVVRKWGDLTAELLIAPDSGSQRSIYNGPLSGSIAGGIADSHGVWFGSDHGIYLYSDAGGLQKVSNQAGYPANGCF